ncbi:hypothetical protein ACFSCX_06015 [Bacillus salitolerans]|uniref:ParB/Sulfiredoxin domain-containing protein n=1 Tax=Bacillus salitolerans TaxID=1437434 RepID=A0ABW4LMI3_9BACI
MGYKLINIDPTNCSFCYRMDGYDCYELRKGVCSLYMSKEKAEMIHKEEKKFGESSVMYCRDFADKLLNQDYFNSKSYQEDLYSIRTHKRDCGHYEFTDGQHRTCIAKHLNIPSMYVMLECHPSDYRVICNACHEKSEIERESKKLINKFLSIFRRGSEMPSNIIDNEYMKFKKDSNVSQIFEEELKR